MATISLTDQDVFTALRTFLVAVLPSGTEIVQAQDNSVPMPVGSFVAMNNVGKNRLSTNSHKYNDTGTNPSTNLVLTPTEFRMQLDFYGDDACEWADIAMTLFRDDFGYNLFPANIKPIHADNPIQIPLIDGEQRYLQRWRSVAVMQYNPIVSVPQDFFVNPVIGIKEVDTTFQPL